MAVVSLSTTKITGKYHTDILNKSFWRGRDRAGTDDKIKNNYYTTKLTLSNSSMVIETDNWLLFSFIR
jgi:hypothetical protein